MALCCCVAGCTVVTVPAPPFEPTPPRPTREGAEPQRDRSPDVRFLPLNPVRPFAEVRALWVVRYTMTSEEAVRQMVEEAAAAGINTLIVQIRGRADAFYRSELEPLGESVRGPDGFDPLALAIEEAHARGLAVHAWVNTHLVWGAADPPQSSAHIVNANPEWLAVPRELGREIVAVDPADPGFVESLIEYARQRPETVEGVYSSPSHPEVKNRIRAVWLDLAQRYDLDGLHFDYIRFPSSDYDYSIGALERFRIWVRSRVPEERFAELDAAYTTDLYALVDGEDDLWGDFRREQVTELVERVYRDVKRLRPRLVVSAAVVADAGVAYGSRYQDWTAWLRDGILDIAVPMAYTPDSGRFEALVRTAREAAGDRQRVWAGIGAYMNTDEGTVEMIDIARAEGAGGVVLFSYDWAVGEGRGDPADPFLQRIGRARFERR